MNLNNLRRNAKFIANSYFFNILALLETYIFKFRNFEVKSEKYIVIIKAF